NANGLCGKFGQANGNYDNISNTWLVLGFLISSPLSPATQSGLCGAFIPFTGFASTNHLHRCSATSILPVPLSCSSLVGRKRQTQSSGRAPRFGISVASSPLAHEVFIPAVAARRPSLRVINSSTALLDLKTTPGDTGRSGFRLTTPSTQIIGARA